MAARAATLLCFALLVVISQRAAAMSPPTYEELSSSLVVNQLAILELMHNSSSASCVDAGTLEETLEGRVDQLLAALEAQQTHTLEVLSVLNSTSAHTMTKVDELREEMKGELAKIGQEVQTAATDTTLQQQEDEAPVPAEVTYLGPTVHNDTIPSKCSGDKILNGSLGSLEVVTSGTYSSSVTCSWSLNFPKGSSVDLTWEYIQMEDHKSCSYDWVEVLDMAHGAQRVYGRKLCGSLSSSFLKHLNVRLQGTHNLKVSFRSDGSNEKRGFKLFYHAH